MRVWGRLGLPLERNPSAPSLLLVPSCFLLPVVKQSSTAEFQLLHVSVLREYLQVDLCQDLYLQQVHSSQEEPQEPPCKCHEYLKANLVRMIHVVLALRRT